MTLTLDNTREVLDDDRRQPTIIELLRENARRRPNDVAYTFVDYEADFNGISESLTWSELLDRARQVADSLAECGSPGDRAVVLAQQSLEYVVGMLGAMLAGFIAVPLPTPYPGQGNDALLGTIRNCNPVALLTRSVDADVCVELANAATKVLPSARLRVIEIDSLAFESITSTRLCDAEQLPDTGNLSKPAYLQYTSGSTSQPSGAIITHSNIVANVAQIVRDHFEAAEGAEKDFTVVSWLPFYHDMGLIVGVLLPIYMCRPAVLMTPVAFVQSPIRWIKHLAASKRVYTAAPNFAYDLVAKRVKETDLIGLRLDDVCVMINGAERVQARTIRQFSELLAPIGLPGTAMRPSYGLAEATVYVVTSDGHRPPVTESFHQDKLSAGYAQTCDRDEEDCVELTSCGAPRSSDVIVVDPEFRVEVLAGQVGEVWASGDHIAAGYWGNAERTEQVFGAQLSDPAPGTPRGPWLRTGDLGFIFDGELFIAGRIKDLLIIDGRNHYPDDIEETVRAVTKSQGRVAAVSVPGATTEMLVIIAEVKDHTDAAVLETNCKNVVGAISARHSAGVADVVWVPSGSLPTTTSGKVRRAESARMYQEGRFRFVDGTER
ncbi:AMP-binding protein [Mycobacterium spongiae]|uniref:AMP-binding protein n=1 Tax=Mycobacterium spongiae TaxID=886343 RepID=A0A975PYF5_9MYCO|nr:AMP-binding protein [Mycobacterium spongiae]QUR68819.1 AMP-binding protein [Mycobacterium spongiae]